MSPTLSLPGVSADAGGRLLGRWLRRSGRLLLRNGPGRRRRIRRGNRLHSGLRLRFGAVALGHEILGRLLDLIGRQRRFGPRRRHVVHCGICCHVGGTTGHEHCGRGRSQGCERKLRDTSVTSHPSSPPAPLVPLRALSHSEPFVPLGALFDPRPPLLASLEPHKAIQARLGNTRLTMSAAPSAKNLSPQWFTKANLNVTCLF